MKGSKTSDNLGRDDQLTLFRVGSTINNVAGELESNIANILAREGEEIDGLEGFLMLIARHG